MLSCWHTQPESRPTFDILESTLKGVFETSVTGCYIAPNEAYVRSNTRIVDRNPMDYSAMIGTPDCYAPAPTF